VVLFGQPSISPDGKWLAFACGSSADGYICKMRIDGSELQRLARLGPWIPDPAWSPIEDLIAISAETSVDSKDSSIWDLYLISPDGTVIRKLTDNPAETGVVLMDINWSPDGQWIAFVASGQIGAEKSDIYIVKVDGSGLRRLTQPPAFHILPQWSPDGNQLAYLAISQNVSYLVIEIEPWNDYARRQIPLSVSGDLSWLHDGSGFVYWSNREDNYDLYRYDIDQNMVLRLTTDPGVDIEPAWSPDGNSLLFRSSRSGHHEIYTMDGSGNEIVRQVENATQNFLVNPFWSRDGRTIFFFLSNHLEDLYELWAVDTAETCGDF
jgi:Tol biopolymer transport system component